VALLLAGSVPDHGPPSHGLTAGATTTALAAASTVVTSAALLPALLLRYTAPFNFVGLVVDDTHTYLSAGLVDMVVFRVGLLAEMLRASVRRGDSTSIAAALSGLRRLQTGYIAAAAENPAARFHTYETGEQIEGWLGDPLRGALVRAAEEGMVGNIAEEDSDQIGVALREATVDAIRAGQRKEARELIQGPFQLGVSVYQVVGSGVINVYLKSPEGLVLAEQAAEEAGEVELATEALAAWAVVTSYAQTQFGMDLHPLWVETVGELGSQPPWHAAAELVMSQEFLRRWMNKMPQGPDAVVINLQLAAYFSEHGEFPSSPPR